jgi:hypothetical protein
MSRLDKEKQAELEQKRMEFAVNAITHLGYEIHFQNNTELRFNYKGSEIRLFPYSGWHTGKTIQDGRGIVELINQIK